MFLKIFVCWFLAIVSVTAFQPDSRGKALAASLFFIVFLSLVFWLNRSHIKRKLQGIPKNSLCFIVSGVLAAVLTEAIFGAMDKVFRVESMAAEKSLFKDLLFTMPWYVLMLFFLRKVLKAYDFNFYQILLLGGIYDLFADGIVGNLFKGQFTLRFIPMLILQFPIFLACYSLIVLVPSVLCEEQGRKASGGKCTFIPKYLYALLLPLTGLAIYILLISAVRMVWG